MRFVEGKHVRDLFAGGKLQKVDHCSAPCRPLRFGNFIRLEPEHLAEVCEEEQIVVRRAGEHFLDEVFFLCLVRRYAGAAPVLTSVFRNGQTLDVAFVSHGDDDVFFFDEVGYIYIGIVVAYLRFSRLSEFILYLAHFLYDYFLYGVH